MLTLSTTQIWVRDQDEAVSFWTGKVGFDPTLALVLSQVVLSFQLPFAIVPLVMFTASRAKMGELVAPRWLTGLCWLIAALIIVLNVNLLSTVLLG